MRSKLIIVWKVPLSNFRRLIISQNYHSHSLYRIATVGEKRKFSRSEKSQGISSKVREIIILILSNALCTKSSESGKKLKMKWKISMPCQNVTRDYSPLIKGRWKLFKGQAKGREFSKWQACLIFYFRATCFVFSFYLYSFSWFFYVFAWHGTSSWVVHWARWRYLCEKYKKNRAFGERL